MKMSFKMSLTPRFKIRITKNVYHQGVHTWAPGDIFKDCYLKKPVDGLYFDFGGTEINIPLDAFVILERY